MTKEELRQQAAISVLNALLETTKHSVIETVALREVYAHVAVAYADSLVNALDRDQNQVEEMLEKWDWKTLMGIHQKSTKRT